MRIDTDRLILVAASETLLRAELADHRRLAVMLSAEVPHDWPPPLNDKDTLRWVLERMREQKGSLGWISWYFLLRRYDGEKPLAIGVGGFRGLPAEDGTVEVGYSVRKENQRAGYATEAVDALVEWAFSNPGVTRVIAHTLPVLAPSIRVLEKNGFRFAGDGEEEGTILFEKLRPA
ncbi:MAG TPA: GNAT family N-acetyltransferase [Candidatus Krumholzibacteria bacterium]|nr:GNAT family N-acetyltransferase [Candidatus Krumholzibacteria bacterium]